MSSSSCFHSPSGKTEPKGAPRMPLQEAPFCCSRELWRNQQETLRCSPDLANSFVCRLHPERLQCLKRPALSREWGTFFQSRPLEHPPPLAVYLAPCVEASPSDRGEALSMGRVVRLA